MTRQGVQKALSDEGNPGYGLLFGAAEATSITIARAAPKLTKIQSEQQFQIPNEFSSFQPIKSSP
jgi:hypothetical protein